MGVIKEVKWAVNLNERTCTCGKWQTFQRSCSHVLRACLGTRLRPRSQKIWNFFFLLKFNMVCTFWIVLMCWCQKWFLKNEKTSLTCILARKVIWKAPATTLPNTLLMLCQESNRFYIVCWWSLHGSKLLINIWHVILFIIRRVRMD
jgi:hypothetical protein